ncbi:hypothetical protein CXF70_16915 [Planomicrobium sp. MB-3u-38]|nr:hypothetical protein CXF70_16915 [Planomicrobium sp. MB-3u-38]
MILLSVDEIKTKQKNNYIQRVEKQYPSKKSEGYCFFHIDKTLLPMMRGPIYTKIISSNF